jgi:hypothetical protein
MVPPAGISQDASTRFRARFTKVLRGYVQDSRSVEESFGAAFDEALDAVALTENEQALVYQELLNWAKKSAHLFTPVHQPYSPRQNRRIRPIPAHF